MGGVLREEEEMMTDEQAQMRFIEFLQERTLNQVALATSALRNAGIGETETAEIARWLASDLEMSAALEVSKFIEWQMACPGYEGGRRTLS
jgi:hypothetical protein